MALKLSDYLQGEIASTELELNDSGSLSFHWSNWNRCCQYHNNSENNGKMSNQIDQSLVHLRNHKIWIKHNLQTVETDLYNLYESYLDNRIRVLWFEQEKDSLISLVSEGGPYIPLSSMRWFDKETYEKFIYKKILANTLPLREFRLTTNIEAVCYFDDMATDFVKVSISQISKDGIVLKFDSIRTWTKIVGAQEICMAISLENIDSIEMEELGLRPSDFVELNNSKQKYVVYRVSPSVVKRNVERNKRFIHQREYFVFCYFSELRPIMGQNILQEALVPFIEILKDQLSKELDEFSGLLATG